MPPAPASAPIPPRTLLLLLLLDFDGTLTTHDSLAALARLAYAHPTRPLPPWEWFTSAYRADWEGYRRGFEAEAGWGKNVEAYQRGGKWEGEIEFLRGVRGVERRSVERVEGGGVFAGVGRGEVGRGGAEWGGGGGLRRGWGRVVGLGLGLGFGGEGEGGKREGGKREGEGEGEVGGLGGGREGKGVEVGVGKVGERGGGEGEERGVRLGGGENAAGEVEVKVKVGVVSVNWSREWVRGVLRGGWRVLMEEQGGKMGEREMQRLDEVEVVANELAFDGEGGLGRYWGEEDGGIWTSGDKVRVLEEVFGVGGKGGEKVSVYVGDSATDLEALMLVDVGVVMRDEEMGASQVGLKEALERVGVECSWIGEFGREGEGGGQRRKVWWARDFDEICDSPLLSTLRDRMLL